MIQRIVRSLPQSSKELTQNSIGGVLLATGSLGTLLATQDLIKGGALTAAAVSSGVAAPQFLLLPPFGVCAAGLWLRGRPTVPATQTQKVKAKHIARAIKEQQDYDFRFFLTVLCGSGVVVLISCTYSYMWSIDVDARRRQFHSTELSYLLRPDSPFKTILRSPLDVMMQVATKEEIRHKFTKEMMSDKITFSALLSSDYFPPRVLMQLVESGCLSVDEERLIRSKFISELSASSNFSEFWSRCYRNFDLFKKAKWGEDRLLFSLSRCVDFDLLGKSFKSEFAWVNDDGSCTKASTSDSSGRFAAATTSAKTSTSGHISHSARGRPTPPSPPILHTWAIAASAGDMLVKSCGVSKAKIKGVVENCGTFRDETPNLKELLRLTNKAREESSSLSNFQSQRSNSNGIISLVSKGYLSGEHLRKRFDRELWGLGVGGSKPMSEREAQRLFESYEKDFDLWKFLKAGILLPNSSVSDLFFDAIPKSEDPSPCSLLFGYPETTPSDNIVRFLEQRKGKIDSFPSLIPKSYRRELKDLWSDFCEDKARLKRQFKASRTPDQRDRDSILWEELRLGREVESLRRTFHHRWARSYSSSKYATRNQK